MNPPNSSSPLAASANLLPKLAALAFLVIWGMGGSEIPLTRLGMIFGSLALFEALTAAAWKKQDPILDWGDLPLVIGSLVAPTALPLYALIATGVVFLGGDAGPGKRLLTTPPTERSSSIPPRYSPSTRSITAPSGFGSQPGANSINPRPMPSGMPGPSSANPSRPPFGAAPRSSFPAPTASSRPASPTSTPSTPAISPAPSTPPSPPPQPATAPKP